MHACDSLMSFIRVASLERDGSGSCSQMLEACAPSSFLRHGRLPRTASTPLLYVESVRAILLSNTYGNREARVGKKSLNLCREWVIRVARQLGVRVTK